MSDVVLNISGLSKRYVLQHNDTGSQIHYRRFSDTLWGAIKSPFIRLREGKGAESARASAAGFVAREDFWALRDVSFSVKRGEVIGVIGRNGAGKSTLLKILSRITAPTEGRIEIEGRVASLLEVGTGFHPELTGRENVYLNGAILGMSRSEIRKKFDEIVAFAEVEMFLDTPVKRYSSGMYVRLAFAVAAHLEPEILIVDEVLAVGDMEFQKKCLGKMQEVSTKEGRTVLFVSHNLAAVNRLCKKSLLLAGGSVAAYADTSVVMNQFMNSGPVNRTEYVPDPALGRIGNDAIVLERAMIEGMDGTAGPYFGSDIGLLVRIDYRISVAVRGLRVGFQLHGADGTVIFNAADTDGNESSERSRQLGKYTSKCIIPANLLNQGQYSISVGSDAPMVVNFYKDNVLVFNVTPAGAIARDGSARPGLISPEVNWEIEPVV
jgi:lipopolysaccharide transport system ATP-binding protein